MKKIFAIVAALGLIMGFCANAFALEALEKAENIEETTAPRVYMPTAPGVALWSVTGAWVLAGAYLSDGLGMPAGASLTGDGPGTDAFYIHVFNLWPVLQINDKIAVKGEFRFADRNVFGLTDTEKLTPSDLSGSDSEPTGGRVIDTYQLYLEWMSPYGQTRFGRTPAGAWGTKFLDSGVQGDRLMIWLNMLPENWGSLLFIQKITEQDAADPGSDQDTDAYYIDLSYKAGFGTTTGALYFVRNAANGVDPYTSQDLWLTGNYAFDALSLAYEVDWGFGEADNGGDQKQLGLYADLGYRIQDWQIGGSVFYCSGDDDGTDDNDQDSMMRNDYGVGKDFNTFQILTGDYMNILNGDNPLSGDSINEAIKTGGTENAGVWAVKGYASYDLSSALNVNGYLGYAAATDEPTDYDSDYGVEAGIGFGYKIMDNLTYGAHFSYLWTGDYFSEGGEKNTQDIYLVAHALSMSF